MWTKTSSSFAFLNHCWKSWQR